MALNISLLFKEGPTSLPNICYKNSSVILPRHELLFYEKIKLVYI